VQQGVDMAAKGGGREQKQAPDASKGRYFQYVADHQHLPVLNLANWCWGCVKAAPEVVDFVSKGSMSTTF
jgi:hypothetical protein